MGSGPVTCLLFHSSQSDAPGCASCQSTSTRRWQSGSFTCHWTEIRLHGHQATQSWADASYRYWIDIRVLQILKATSLWRVNRPLLPGKLSFQSTMDISLRNLLWSTRALPKIPMTSVDWPPIMADGLWFKRKKCTIYYFKGASLVAQMVKNLLQCRRPQFDPWVGKIPWKRERLPTPVFLPGGFHGERSLVGYSPWGHKELDTTERLTHTHTYTHSVSKALSTNGWSSLWDTKSPGFWGSIMTGLCTVYTDWASWAKGFTTKSPFSYQCFKVATMNFILWNKKQRLPEATPAEGTPQLSGWAAFKPKAVASGSGSWAPATLPFWDCLEGGKMSTKWAWRKGLKQENGRLQTSRKSSKIRNHPQVFITQDLFLSHWRSPTI